MSKQFWGVIVIVVLLFAGVFALSGNKKAGAPSKSSGATLTKHIEGKGKSGVTVVEYGDFQCPYCGQAYPVIKQAVADMNDQIFFQFRNFPLTSLHQNAFAASRAAEAAALQGKFWQMHDALYESQAQWTSSNSPATFFNQLAQQIGLDVTKFKSDYASSKVNDLINADLSEGTRLKIQGTPAFFIDGKMTDLPYSSGPEAVKKVIRQAITAKQSAAAKTKN